MKFPVRHRATIASASPPFGEVWIEMSTGGTMKMDTIPSPPFGEVWIEIKKTGYNGTRKSVTSLRGGVD